MGVDKEKLNYFTLTGQIQKTIQKAENLEEATAECAKLYKQYLSADHIIVWYAEHEKICFHPYYFLSEMDLTFAERKNDAGIVGRVYKSGNAEKFLTYNKGTDPQSDSDIPNINSLICVPFTRGNEIIGAIQFIRSGDSEPFTEEMSDIAEIMTNLIGMYITTNEKLCAPWRFNEVILSARDIVKSFKSGEGRSVVLKGVNMDIYKGEFLVILGESGSGKSTFMNIIGGMDKADSGSIKFMGKEMSGLSQDELTLFRRQNIGFIFQSYNLISSLTAAQNIDLIGELVAEHLSSEEVLDMVGLLSRKNSYPAMLSGGQQQRVSIARALVKKPLLLFADEPTSALDYTTSIEVLDVLEKIVKSGTTLVMVTHNEEITRMADRVVRLRGGKTYDITLNRNPVHATDLIW